MRFPQPIDSTLHGFTDYTVGALLGSGLFARLANIEDTPAARQIRTSGLAHAGYSALTNYPLGAVKLIPYKLHLALDLVGAVALGATPFVTGQHVTSRFRRRRSAKSQWIPHVALAAFELASLAMSDPSGRGDFHGDVEKVHELNRLDPGEKIHRGGTAVRRAESKSPTGLS
jgi:hypothetical protein